MAVLISILFLILFVYFLYHQIFLRRRLLPPGPFPLPIFGNLHHVNFYDLGKSYLEYGKKYGGIFTVWLHPTIPTVVITDYEILKEAFITHGEAFAGRAPLTAFLYAMKASAPESLKNGPANWGLIMSSGETWREIRRFAVHTLKDFGLSRNLMEEKVDYDLDRLVSHIKHKLRSGENVMDLSAKLATCISSVIANLLFNERYEYDDPEFVQILKIIKENMETFDNKTVFLHQALGMVPFLYKIPLFGHFGMDKLLAAEIRFHDAFKKLLDRQAEKSKSQKFTEPDCYVEAYRQQKERYRKSGRMDLEDLYRTQMPYTVACILEIQRHTNLLPANVPHCMMEDLMFRGFLLKKGTIIEGSLASVMYDPENFENPLEFKPERFYKTDSSTNNSEKVIPFGMGKRLCVGESLARMELFLIFVTLLQHFDFEFATQRDKDAFLSEPLISFLRQPRHYDVRVNLRE